MLSDDGASARSKQKELTNTDLKLALENVKHDKKSAIAFIKRELPRDPMAHVAEHLSNDALAELYMDAYKRSEWGV